MGVHHILAHQNVRKLDENTYTTAMTGLKYKLAHKRAGGETWSASERAQRRQLIRILQGMIDDLSREPEAQQPAPGKDGELVQPKGLKKEERRRTTSPPPAPPSSRRILSHRRGATAVSGKRSRSD